MGNHTPKRSLVKLYLKVESIMFYKAIISHKITDESDSAFARRIGISPSRLESWKRFNPKIKTLVQLAAILGVSPGSLINEEGEKDETGGRGHKKLPSRSNNIKRRLPQKTESPLQGE
jgi:transcriptional regulator with XRE-family HTH domain